MKNPIVYLPGIVLIFVTFSNGGCSAPTTVDEIDMAEGALSGGRGPIAGLSATELADFNHGMDQFSEIETVANGLGPAFNEVSCGTCHSQAGVGGGSLRLVTRVGKTTSGAFNALASEGGELLQAQGIGGLVAGCDFKGELVPADATIAVHRRTTPLFGLGLVDVTTDRTLQDLAASQPSAIRGRVNQVFNIRKGSTTAGKFGWKSQVPSLLQFSGDAYVNEMGITSPDFPNENLPQGSAVTLAACDIVPGIEDPGGLDVDSFKNFMRLLAPPSRGPSDNGVRAGDKVFSAVGCDGCHVRTLKSSNSSVTALAFKEYHPFSDFLLHEMGSLGDGIPDQGIAKATEMRTAPLWGLRSLDQTGLLHDGRAHSLSEAILQHDGQGAAARNAFATLASTDSANLITFLNSL